MPISIFPLFLLVGVASNFPFGSPRRFLDNDTVFQPILGPSNERRICVELCSSGLGGDPCGEDCKELSTFGVPIQSTSLVQNAQNETIAVGKPRNESCPLLCENNLGYPLCKCKTTQVQRNRVDFVKICANFCEMYDYKMNGCQSCNVYKNIFQEVEQSTPNGENANRKNGIILESVTLSPDWIQWCIEKCALGEGGSACNCDADDPIMRTSPSSGF